MPEGRLDSITRTFALDVARTEPVILTKGPCCRVKVTKYASPGGAFPVRLRVNGPTADPWTIPGPVNIAFDEPVTDVYFENDASAGGVVEFSLDPAGGTGFEINPSSNFSVPSNFALLNVAQNWTAKQNFTVGIDVSDGSAGNPEGVAFKSELGLGIYRPFAGGLGIAHGGFGRVVADFSAVPFALRPFAGQAVDLGLAGAEWGSVRLKNAAVLSWADSGGITQQVLQKFSDNRVLLDSPDSSISLRTGATFATRVLVENAGGVVVGTDPGGTKIGRFGGSLRIPNAQGYYSATATAVESALVYSDASNFAHVGDAANWAGIKFDPGVSANMQLDSAALKPLAAGGLTIGTAALPWGQAYSNAGLNITAGIAPGSSLYGFYRDSVSGDLAYQLNGVGQMRFATAALLPLTAGGMLLGSALLPWGDAHLAFVSGIIIRNQANSADIRVLDVGVSSADNDVWVGPSVNNSLRFRTNNIGRWTIDTAGVLAGDDTNGGLLVVSRNIAAAAVNDYIRFRRQSLQKVVLGLDLADAFTIGDGTVKWLKLNANNLSVGDGTVDYNKMEALSDGHGLIQIDSASTTINVLDKPATAGNMGMRLWDTSALTSKRVLRGASDSGGVGFRQLIVNN